MTPFLPYSLKSEPAVVAAQVEVVERALRDRRDDVVDRRDHEGVSAAGDRHRPIADLLDTFELDRVAVTRHEATAADPDAALVDLVEARPA